MDTLRVGTFLAPRLLPLYEAVTEALGRRLETAARLATEDSYDAYTADRNDVVFICGLAYVHFERRGIVPALPIAAPVPSPARYRGRPIYFSDVIVRRDSGVRSFLDLRGGRWAINEPLSQSGYGITRHRLVQLGETGGFFGEVVASGSHASSISRVLAGEIDGTAVDSHLLDVAARDDPALRRDLRTVDVLGPSTIQPVMVSRRLDEGLRDEIRDGLLGLHRDPAVRAALEEGLVERFTAVEAASYDDLRRMLSDCEAAGFLELR